MATSAQTLANRENARHSTGPRTEEGKAHSAANSRKHGLTSTELVIDEGEQPEFDTLVDSLAAEIDCRTELETLTFANLVHAAWNLRRCRRAEATLAATADPLTDDDEAAARKMQRILRYAAQSERSYYRALKELRVQQTNRALQIVSNAVLPQPDENGVLQNEPIPRLAEIPALLKTGWRAPDPRYLVSQEAVAAEQRAFEEMQRRFREEYLANPKEWRRQNEAKFGRTA